MVVRVKKQDLIYEKLLEVSKHNSNSGVSTQELVHELKLSRANISNELNKLHDLGKVRKSNGRPVLYYPTTKNKVSINNEGSNRRADTLLDEFVKNNPSLKLCGNQAKAAVLYPPRGMNMLILGETGVGKSMFAGLIYKYAIEMQTIKKNSPFIIFNCADYVNNPQLLLSQLFGAKKGAYTGAISDKEGLIEKADKGILFLDEVHRLPSEGQEMLFVFLDQGKFRRLGETDCERKANVLLICATTEEPSSTLLNTFTRRIPMTISIPSLKERGSEERLNLIRTFFRDESFRLQKEIKLSINALKAFLQYPCPNNIGQLKSDIQLVCAKAYADYLTEKKGSIKINTSDLPSYISEYLYLGKDNEDLLENIGENGKYLTINKDDTIVIASDSNIRTSIYDFISEKVKDLKNKSLDEEEVNKMLQKEFDNYFNKYMSNDKKILNSLVDESIAGLIEEFKEIIYRKLNRRLSKNTSIGLVLYLNTAIEQVKTNRHILNPQLFYIRTKHRLEFETALEIIKVIEDKLDFTLPIDEAGYITLFLVREDKGIKIPEKRVGVLVICHGDSTATSMVKVANKLLGEKYAIGIDLPLDKSRMDILDILRNFIKNNRKEGYLFLVDMGSLVSISTILSEELNVKIKQITNVSTIHVIEATRKALIGDKLNDIYDSLIIDKEVKYVEKETNYKKKYVVITACLTGEGSADIMANYLRSHLRYNKNIFEIVPLSINNKKNFESYVKNIEKDKEVVCIVSSLKLQVDIPQYTLNDMLSLKAIDKIQDIIDIKCTYEQLNETLKQHIKNTDGEILYNDVVQVLFNFQKKTNNTLSSEIFIPIAMHIACMVDRLLKEETAVEFKDSNEYKDNNLEMYNLVKKELEVIVDKYDITITQDEYCYITEFFSEM
ncbi:sigma 54-interacting transcriptional regulator [Clostridium sp. YIM B02551]|uniref:sigma 54-interacting transcriptional regulator n=1 Tax=Clostridium sp. YIM B02551 TaxID=2910679 RepID=UPI001EECE8AB|nr:sigma-54-dependent transcriptional regulator [Clostridium sp. YIM B02551]